MQEWMRMVLVILYLWVFKCIRVFKHIIAIKFIFTTVILTDTLVHVAKFRRRGNERSHLLIHILAHGDCIFPSGYTGSGYLYMYSILI